MKKGILTSIFDFFVGEPRQATHDETMAHIRKHDPGLISRMDMVDRHKAIMMKYWKAGEKIPPHIISQISKEQQAAKKLRDQ